MHFIDFIGIQIDGMSTVAMATKDLPEETSVYAKEGTKAHEVAEYKIKQYLGIKGSLNISKTG